jgi:thiol:disulfide interchange protein DsbD
MNFRRITAYAIIAFFIISISSFAQSTHIKLSAKPSKLTVKAGEDFVIRLNMLIDEHWYTYSLKSQLNKEGIGPTQTEITVTPAELLKIVGNIKAPKPHVKKDEGFEMDIEYYKGSEDFDIPVKAVKDIDFSKDKGQVVAYIQLCDTARCLPPEEYKVEIQNEVFKADKGGTTDSQTQIDDKKSKGIFSFLWFAMTAGALALLTPCVFPMVPITVSFFTKRAEKGDGKGLRDSIVYALGIIITFTALGFLLALIFGATGIQDFATNPWLNLFIAVIFIVFALNLFGAFELTLPSGLLNKLNSKSQQGNGIGSVLLMGLTFSLTSFTCTVPFVGSALVSASSGEWFYPIIGMLGFSLVFAAPFFLLALFPTAMQKLPKAGGWMNNVKVVMGLLEIAAAIKFFSNVDLVWAIGILPKEMFLSIWIGCSILIALYILGVFRLPHDNKIEGVGSLRLMFALFFATVTFYLLSGLFGKPLGELDAFLPPPDYNAIMSKDMSSASMVPVSTDQKTSVKATDDWPYDYKAAVEEAKKQNKNLFIDFTGFTCTNCRWMEINMFSKQSVSSLMSNFVKVRLYTDRKQEPYLSNKAMQMSRFNSIELPLYAIVTPDEQMLATKSFTRNENEFVEFLKKGMK